MPQDATNFLDVLLLFFAAAIGAFVFASIVGAWRHWSNHRRIDKHLGRR
jgi:hypothetical protein